MLENLKLRRSTYLIFIVWGAIAFFLASVIFKFQPLAVSFSINDHRLLQGLLRGILLLAAYVVITIFPPELPLSFPVSFILVCLDRISGSS
ncbi:hypothetical protein [Lentilactobacillus buchneri]|uniref:hypothetical protein n=1 Tax=Lentilactobacillus buchneri TaxID=1581 RepID=UPI0021A8D813|nr:hypothetical protein [Lentilactobacillus buchneri]